MTELIFICIAIALYITVKLLPSYTPEQVGSNKLIVRRQPMEKKKVTINQCTIEQAWYNGIEPYEVTVTPSWDNEAYAITDGIFKGKHVAKRDCKQAVAG